MINNSSWWMFTVGVCIGTIAPCLIGWGSVDAKIKKHDVEISNRVLTATFNEYKEGNDKLLGQILEALVRIEGKVDK